ncbi:uncharacterized protein K02A2.6 isoform X2 [Toxorhynchites rutilus septentrionalis]|uniref:uncharacterized protein K02A2.6 isoform X2 n=1 Tax=Toxorhynchites rutilus septentrionalis TaxID=329112 RepID=UPI0024787BBB|nr:uncharacterized protein K02A2.6 isoform X2 [Toxorhynchites rutilus septentrionalis]
MPIDFRIFANELCCVGEVLLRIDRVVVPVKLRDRVLEIAHEGHLGIRMMKTFLRAVTWWPKMDKHIEMFVRKCQPCTLVAAPDPPEPMIRKQLPTSPWEEIAIDFLGPLPEGQYLLVAVDYYSRYVEVAEMTSITTKDTVVELATMFSRYGITRVMRADNGPQLSGDCVEFRQFCKEFGIDLVNTTPYWPQANGEVERQNRTILKRLRIAQELGQNWRKSPSEMMFGRRIRSKLPAVPAIMRNDADTRDRDRLFKAKGKMYADARRKARTNPMAVGDKVFVKRTKKDNKLSTDFSPEHFEVTERQGSEVTLRSTVSGKRLKRNVVHLKKAETGQESVSSSGSSEEDGELQNKELLSEDLAENDRQDVPISTKRLRVQPKNFKDYVAYETQTFY